MLPVPETLVTLRVRHGDDAAVDVYAASPNRRPCLRRIGPALPLLILLLVEQKGHPSRQTRGMILPTGRQPLALDCPRPLAVSRMGGHYRNPSPGKSAWSVRHGLTSHMGRLLSPELPSKDRVRCLVESYFSNVHPLRFFAFVHKPPFLRRLDSGFPSEDAEIALLHVICALGAK